MKKLIFSAALFLALGYTANSQNSFKVSVGEGLCLEALKVTYSDNSQEEFELGCTGPYSFDIGEHVVSVVSINKTDCPAGQTTKVLVDDNVSALAKVKVIQVDQQKLDSILQLIR